MYKNSCFEKSMIENKTYLEETHEENILYLTDDTFSSWM